MPKSNTSCHTAPDVLIRRVEPYDNEAMTAIILAGLTEMGADGQDDPELRNLHQTYQGEDRVFLVGVGESGLLGGGGIAPLRSGERETCELQRLYLSPNARGLGLGERLTRSCLAFARDAGYKHCYLETMTRMEAARALYRKLGFVEGVKQKSGGCQSACNRFFTKRLDDM